MAKLITSDFYTTFPEAEKVKNKTKIMIQDVLKHVIGRWCLMTALILAKKIK